MHGTTSVLKNMDVFSAFIKQNHHDVLYVFIIHLFWFYFLNDSKMNTNLSNTRGRGVFSAASLQLFPTKYFILRCLASF